MRATIASIQPFDLIQKEPKRVAAAIREPLLRVRQHHMQKKELIAFGLKDSCAHWDRQQQNSRRESMLRLIPVINPQSKLLLIWNILIQIAVMFNFFMGPLVASFTQQAYQFDVQTSAGITLNAVSVALLYADLLVRFHVGFYRREKLITDRKQIFRHYFGFQFWVDLASTICVTVYMAGGTYELCYVRLGVYLRAPTLLQIDASIVHNLNVSKHMLSLYKLLRMVVMIWLVTTWAACIFFIIDYSIYLDQTNSYNKLGQMWLTNSMAVNYLNIMTSFPQWYIWYEYALYWSIQTSCTTGYGDLTPQNPPEIMYCNVIMILMTVLFAYFINEVWSIIKELQEDSPDDNWHKVKDYLRGLALAEEVKLKVNDYMQEVFVDEQEQQIEQFIAANLSHQLKDEFYFAVRAKFFLQGPLRFLANSLQTTDIPMPLIYSLEQSRAPQDQVVYAKGQVDRSIYFVRSGSIRLKEPSSGLKHSVRQNNYFGAWQFFNQQPRCHSAIAEGFVKLWRMGYKQLKQGIKNSQLMNQLLHITIEQAQLQKQESVSLSMCWKCQTSSHFLPRCPQICYQPTAPLIKQLEGNEANPRVNRSRNSIKSDKMIRKFALFDKNIVCESANNFSYYRATFNIKQDE